MVGVDNLNAYYDVRLKQARLARLDGAARASRSTALDVADRDAVHGAGATPSRRSTAIVHLAAQAGVRHSLVDPYAYVQANVMGHLVMLEAARRLPRLRHSSMPARRRSMARTGRCRSARRTGWTRRFRSMRRPSGPTS